MFVNKRNKLNLFSVTDYLFKWNRKKNRLINIGKRPATINGILTADAAK